MSTVDLPRKGPRSRVLESPRLHVTTPGGLHSVREEMKRATDDINLLPVTPARTKYRKEPGNNGLLDGSSSFDFGKRRFIVTD